MRIYSDDYETGSEVDSICWNMVNDAWDNFTADTDWTIDLTNWTETIGASGTLILLPNYMGYDSVVQIIRSSNDVSMYAAVTPGDTGIAFLVRAAQVNGVLELKTFEDNDGTGDILIYMKFDSDGNIEYVDSGGSDQTIQTYSADTWYYVEARNINHSAGTYDIYVNNTLKVTGATMRNTGTSSDSIEIDCTSDGTFYIACVDEGADTGYSDGRFLYITDCKLSFLATVSASTTNSYTIYFDTTSQGDPGYSGMSRSTNTVTCSDGTAYTFPASENDRFIYDMIDKNSVEWSLFTNRFLEVANDAYSSACTPLWLEDNTIFCEVNYRTGVALETSTFFIYDNVLIKA